MKWQQWDSNYEAVHKFAETHGHVKLPKKDPETRRLSAWLRSQNNRVDIPSYQKAKLDNLQKYGFIKKPHREIIEEKWLNKYDKLKAFYQAKGHCNVAKADNESLFNWVLRQRQLAKNKTLLEERKKKLEEINFDFRCKFYKSTSWAGEHVKNWEIMLGRLVEFRRVHGHSMVPVNDNNDLKLGNWVATQRACYKSGRMDGDRKEKLDQLGFVWDMKGNSRR